MRPDTRSFSFTWMKGSSQKSLKNTQQQHQRFDNVETEGQDTVSDRENRAQEGSFDNTTTDCAGWGNRRGSSGSRLRKLSNSLVKLRGANRYASIGNVEDENNWQKISEEPISLEDDDEDYEAEERRMDIHMEPDVVNASKPKAQQQQIPFKPLQINNGQAITEGGEEKSNKDETVTGNGLSLSKRLNKTVQDVKASLGNFSQRFRSSRRRYRMGPGTPGSVTSPTKKILGRTPTKLYSPFGIDSPITMKTPKRLIDRASTPRLTRTSMVSGLVYSPSNNFRRDLDEARRGMQDFHILSRDITRRSVRF